MAQYRQNVDLRQAQYELHDGHPLDGMAFKSQIEAQHKLRLSLAQVFWSVQYGKAGHSFAGFYTLSGQVLFCVNLR